MSHHAVLCLQVVPAVEAAVASLTASLQAEIQLATGGDPARSPALLTVWRYIYTELARALQADSTQVISQLWQAVHAAMQQHWGPDCVGKLLEMVAGSCTREAKWGRSSLKVQGNEVLKVGCAGFIGAVQHEVHGSW